MDNVEITLRTLKEFGWILKFHPRSYLVTKVLALLQWGMEKKLALSTIKGDFLSVTPGHALLDSYCHLGGSTCGPSETFSFNTVGFEFGSFNQRSLSLRTLGIFPC